MTTPDEDIEVQQLREELESLKGQLAVDRHARRTRVRTTFMWILSVLAVLVTVLALLFLWTFRTLNNTDLFVDRVGSIIENPAVAQEIGNEAAAQLVTALDLQTRIKDVLPEQAQIVAGPITTATQNYLAQATTKLIGTEQFQAAWDAALRTGHELTINVLSGKDTTAVTNQDGMIVLNITPIVNVLLAEGSDFLSGLLNKEINAPTVTSENVDQAIAALEKALGVDLPSDFGTITLFQSDNLATAQQWYSVMKTMAFLAPLAALLLIALAVAVSARRLRTFLGIVVGVAMMLLFVALALTPLKDQVVSAVSDQGLQGAVSQSFATITASLLRGITVVVVLGVIAALILFFMGKSKAAVAGRGALVQTPTLAARHRGLFLGGGAVVALILLAIIPGRTWGQLLFVGLLYAAYALAVVLAPLAAHDEPPADDDNAIVA